MNDAGGIMLKKFNKKVPIEFVSYDDQGKPDELLKLTERLIQQDKVDMILSPYATPHEPRVGADHQQVRVSGDHDDGDHEQDL